MHNQRIINAASTQKQRIINAESTHNQRSINAHPMENNAEPRQRQGRCEAALAGRWPSTALQLSLLPSRSQTLFLPQTPPHLCTLESRHTRLHTGIPTTRSRRPSDPLQRRNRQGLFKSYHHQYRATARSPLRQN